jgi:hypothetical protein
VSLGIFVVTQGVDAWALGFGEWLWGRPGDEPVWQDEGTRALAFLSLLIGSALASAHYEAMGALRDLAQLRPVLGCTPAQFESLSEEASRVPTRRRRLAGAAGIAGAAGAIVGGNPDVASMAIWLDHDLVTFAVVGALVGWLLATGAAARSQQDRAFDRALGLLPRIDLFDLDALGPFARRGLRRALGLAITVSLFAMALVEVARFGRIMPVLAIVLVPWTLATLSFLRPVLGVRRRIREEKRSVLARTRAEIRDAEAALRSTPAAAGAPPGSLADLVAYHDFVDALPEWPFDSPTLARFVLYLAIPLGSWVGGAMVERLLSAALD